MRCVVVIFWSIEFEDGVDVKFSIWVGLRVNFSSSVLWCGNILILVYMIKRLFICNFKVIIKRYFIIIEVDIRMINMLYDLVFFCGRFFNVIYFLIIRCCIRWVNYNVDKCIIMSFYKVFRFLLFWEFRDVFCWEECVY